MRVTIVGCSGSLAGPDSATSCYLLEADDALRTWRLVLDLGAGAVGPLQRYTRLEDIDAVAISHGHADHCADVGALSVALRHGPSASTAPPRRSGGVALLGPPGLDATITAMAASPGALTPFAYQALEPGRRIAVGPFLITCAAGEHPVPSLAFRVEGPREGGEGRGSLTYTGDTATSAAVAALAMGTDVLLAEAGWGTREDAPAGRHMTAAEAGALATAAHARELILTHLPPWEDASAALAAASAAYAGPAALAQPGATRVV